MISPDHVQFWAKSLSFLSSSLADLCACYMHIWPMHLLQQCWSCHKTLPLSICQLLAVPCTHLIQHVYCTFCFVTKFNDFRLSWITADCWIMMEWRKVGNWFVLLWDIWHKCEILGKSKNRLVFIMLPGRLELLWNFSFVLLHCPNECQFFVFQAICKVNRRKEFKRLLHTIVLFYSTLSP